jgi:hypothetical protein
VTLPRLGAVLAALVVVGLVAVAVGHTEASFSLQGGNPADSYSAAPDFVAPTATRTVVADPTNGPSYAVRQCRFYYTYADVADSGNPPSGVASVVADLTQLTAGVGADPLLAGSYTLGATSYGYRGLPHLTTAAPGSRTYALTSTDNTGNLRVQSPFPATVIANNSAISAIFLTGVEQGVVSASALGVFDLVAGSGVSADASVHRNGSYSLRLAPNYAATYAAASMSGAGSAAATRFALRFSALPTATTGLAAWVPAAGTWGALMYDAASGRFGVQWGTDAMALGTVGPAVGAWYVVEMQVTLSNPRTIQWRIDGIDQPSASSAEPSSSLVWLGFGTTDSNAAYAANYDDIIASRAASDYPIGDGKVLALRVNGVGSHDGSNRFRNDDNSGIDGDSWTRVDDVPADSTADYVKQVTAAGNRYLEFTFADTAETCINAVGALLAYHSAGSGNNSGTASIFNGGSESVIFSGRMNSTTLSYAHTVVSPGGAAWTTAAVNSLVARVGYANDVNPNPYWDALLLEYDVPVG